jgi:acetolactate synthase-1/2/3 large subunit
MIFSNRSYKILYSQLGRRRGRQSRPARERHADARPAGDRLRGLAKSMGVPGGQAHDLEELTKQLTYAMSQRGPYLVDVVM